MDSLFLIKIKNPFLIKNAIEVSFGKSYKSAVYAGKQASVRVNGQLSGWLY